MKLIKRYLIYKFLYSWLILLFYSTIHWASEPKTSALHRPEPCMPAVPGQMRELPSEAPGIPYKLPRQKNPWKAPNGSWWRPIEKHTWNHDDKKGAIFSFCAELVKNPENSEKERIDQIGNSQVGLSRKRLFGIFWMFGDTIWYYPMITTWQNCLKQSWKRRCRSSKTFGSDNVHPGSPQIRCLPFFILYPLNSENK